FTRQYVKTRNTERLVAYNNMSRHIQFESVLSLTGSNADVRIPVKPSDNGLAIAHLYNALSKKAGKAGVAGLTDLPKKLASKISSVADELWDHRGQSLVVCGVNHVECQVLVNAINSLIGSYGSTIDLDNPSRQRLGSDSNMISLVKEIAEDKVGAIIAYNANPAYDFPGFPVDKLKSMLSISLSSNMDETGDASRYICPDHNSLESWNIYEPVAGYVGISQPTIHPIFDTRSAQETLMRWGGLGNTSHYAYLKAFYTANYGGGAGKSWDQAVHDGFVQLKQAPAKAYNAGGDVNAASTALSNMASSAKGMELSVFQTVAIRDGKLANNPWLQELPDPISKATWDNFLAVSPEQAKKNGWEQGDIVELEVNGRKFKLPVLPQPGQAEGSVSAALGYGHTKMGKVANNVGQNLYPAVKAVDGRLSYDSPVTKISKTGDSHKIAQTQTYHSIRDDVFDRPRPIVKDTILSKYQRNPASGNQDYPALVSLWPERPEIKNSAYSWGMAIDLNSCTGCSGCIISCQAENNVAVVGKEEVANRREMHWIKIDRFYSGSPEAPEVTFLPMMCQHCDHAPCETVCPVLATTHTMDGLNHQAYNRCVGTRYCANNCPYKVRRFNWFEYSNNDKFDFNLNNSVGKLASNPDVVVRSRGVMEKCSMCIQRIQEAKLKAKKEGVQLKDGDIKMACEQSCPSQAIVFGNLKDPESKISRLFANKRKYHVIEEIKTLPSVGYLTRVRNKSSREI
ncbi:MAG: 4Fe-4S dicluster domain-containing protein, partial [Spirochaetota bacterium]|nr:4Fe-4S dicluster domain-containing protein [Spirochaetota bacterium]